MINYQRVVGISLGWLVGIFFMECFNGDVYWICRYGNCYGCFGFLYGEYCVFVFVDIISTMFYWDLADIVQIIYGSILNKHGAGMRDDEMGFGSSQFSPLPYGDTYIYNAYILVGGLEHVYLP